MASLAATPLAGTLTITTTSLPAGEVGVAYLATLEASGGATPYTWTITTGSLPAGLTLNGATGAITGTPTSPGTSSFTVKVTDSTTPEAQTATASLSITVVFPTAGTKLTAAGETGAGELGFSVAMSSDGSTALIGAPTEDGEAGAAYVYRRSGSTWGQPEKITASGETGAGQFGISVALSADGKTALIGAQHDNSAAGSAWVFTYSGTKWEQTQKITVTNSITKEGIPPEFGNGVALSENGNTAVIATPNDNDFTGAVWVFTRSEFGKPYAEKEKLTAASGETGYGEFGSGMALSGSGETLLIGAPHNNAPTGAAWWFQLGSSGKYEEKQHFSPSDENGGESQFGSTVAISADGKTAIFGGLVDHGESNVRFAGAAWVYTLGESWAEQKKLTGPTTGPEAEIGAGEFGRSVALSENGNVALVGAEADNSNVGAAWLFTRSGTTWSSAQKLTGAGESGKGDFGYSAALSPNASTALIGGPTDHSNVGAVWVFPQSTLAVTTTSLPPAIVGQAYSTTLQAIGGVSPYTWSISAGSLPAGLTLSESGAITGTPTSPGIASFTVKATDSESHTATASLSIAVAFTNPGSKLIASGESGVGQLGSSVAISANGETALVGAPNENSRTGAVYVYRRSGSTWVQQERLTVGGVSETAFGSSVALSGDGKTALISAPFANLAFGAVWVFRFSGTRWEQKQQIFPSGLVQGEEPPQCCNSLALSEDGNTALIATPDNSSHAGAAWVYTRSEFGAEYTAKEKISPMGATSRADFGSGVALSASGETVLIGASHNEQTGHPVGEAWWFQLGSTSGKYEERERFTPTDEAGGESHFGDSVALSTDGKTAVFAGLADEGASSTKSAGAAWVYTLGSSWVEQQKLTGPTTGPEAEIGAGQFGNSAALSENGNVALVSGDADNASVGAAWEFIRSGTNWNVARKLTGAGESGKGDFGYSAALSANASIALIGGATDNGSVGAVWVFPPTPPTITTTSMPTAAVGHAYSATLQASGGIPPFTWSVTAGSLPAGLSLNEGTGVISGIPTNASVSSFTVKVTDSSQPQAQTTTATLSIGVGFSNPGSKLTEPGSGGLGRGAALSSDGSTALVGGNEAAYVLKRSGSSWIREATLTGSRENGFGSSVALSGDGKTALVGATGEHTEAGAVWEFTFSGTKWEYSQKITVNNAIRPAYFGSSVALSENGNTALIAASSDNAGTGAVWVFTRSAFGSAYAEKEKLTAAGETGKGGFGSGVALSASGETALIGAQSNEQSGHPAGAAWWFQLESSTGKYVEKQQFTPSDEAGGESQFGASVALSADGKTALLGGPVDKGELGTKAAGAAWVYTLGSSWEEQQKLTGPTTGPAAELGAGEFGHSVAFADNGSIALIGADAEQAHIGAAWVFTRSGTTWSTTQRLTGASESGEGRFGVSVALSENGTAALVGGQTDNSGGAAWMFPAGAPTITTTRLHEGDLGRGYSAKLEANSGIPPYSWTIAGGSLPAGFTLNGATGVISGMPTSTGTSSFTVKVTDSDPEPQTATATVSITVGSAPSAPATKLTASGAGELGSSVSLSSDGRTALVGAPTENNKAGAAYVYRHSGSIWSQPEKLTASGESGAGQFGFSVALSGDGKTALIGAPTETGTAKSVWVFTYSGTKWEYKQKITVSNTEEFGYSLALSENGNTAAISTPNGNGSTGAGEVWVFTRSGFGSAYTEKEKVIPPSSSKGIEFGYAIALSGSGETLLIGADTNGIGPGAVWWFQLGSSSEKYEEKQVFAPGDEAGGESHFGRSVAISADGKTAIFGGVVDNGEANERFAGAAWVYTLGSSGWEEQKKLTGPTTGPEAEVGPGEFGHSVALSENGNTALVGAEADTANQGVAWVFTRSGTTWSVAKTLAGGEDEIGAGELGYSAALSANASTALIGGPADNSNAGAAWVFQLLPLPAITNVSPNHGPSTGGEQVTITGTNFTGATGVKFGSAAATGVEVKSETQIVAVVPACSGAVEVTVTTPSGTSAANPPGDVFTCTPVFSTSIGLSFPPTDVAVNSEGDIWVSSWEAGTVEELKENGEPIRSITALTSPCSGRLDGPYGLALDSSNNLWVSDLLDGVVRKFSPTGTCELQLGVGGAPRGIGIDTHGNVWVSGTAAGCLQEFTSAGTSERTVGCRLGGGAWTFPGGLAPAANGRIWLADVANSRVIEVGEAGEYLGQIGNTTNCGPVLCMPWTVATDASGHVFVSSASRIDEFSEGGELLGQLGAFGSSVGQMEVPLGLAVASNGSVWVADTGDGRLDKWTGD